MRPNLHRDPDLDSLIEEITVDCYNEEEQLAGFETAFYDAALRAPEPSSARTSKCCPSPLPSVAAS